MQQQKRCPQCGLASPLLAKFCANCGHQFRTDFSNRTQVMPAPPPVQPSQSNETGMPIVALVLALFSLLFLAFEPPIALILSLASIVYAHIRLRGVTALSVGIALFVAISCALIAGYRAGWDVGKHRAEFMEYQWTNRRDLPALPSFAVPNSP
jgi:hypothetical protein